MAKATKIGDIQLNHHNISKILTSNAMVEALDEVGKKVLAEVKDGAPVKTGHYKESLRLEHAVTDRAVVRVVSDDEASLAIEAEDGPMIKGLLKAKE